MLHEQVDSYKIWPMEIINTRINEKRCSNFNDEGVLLEKEDYVVWNRQSIQYKLHWDFGHYHSIE